MPTIASALLQGGEERLGLGESGPDQSSGRPSEVQGHGSSQCGNPNCYAAGRHSNRVVAGRRVGEIESRQASYCECLDMLIVMPRGHESSDMLSRAAKPDNTH